MDELRHARVPFTAVDVIYTVREVDRTFLIIEVGSHLETFPRG